MTVIRHRGYKPRRSGAKRNATTKAEKKATHKQIDHARLKQRRSENHSQKGKEN